MRGLVRELDDSVVERNYAKEPLAAAEIKAIVKAAGGVMPVLNTRHAIAKENGWKEKAPSQAAFIAAIGESENVIRRPILLKGGRVVVGKDLDAVRSILSSKRS